MGTQGRTTRRKEIKIKIQTKRTKSIRFCTLDGKTSESSNTNKDTSHQTRMLIKDKPANIIGLALNNKEDGIDTVEVLLKRS